MSELTHRDLLNPMLKDIPPEWTQWDIPLEIWQRIAPHSGFLMLDEWQKLERILKADWLLIRNVHNFRCGRCNQVHPYFTFLCVERPFNRLSAIFAYSKRLSDDERYTFLDGIRLGTIVPITPTEAKGLRWKIALRGGQLPESEEH